jgi:hypothetical protein
VTFDLQLNKQNNGLAAAIKDTEIRSIAAADKNQAKRRPRHSGSNMRLEGTGIPPTVCPYPQP